ncbi:hypothetical protein [Neobacillus sp.]|uniref:hypothetical protein n=1 Tax=Neobacillus sp. TaxID=2675273 RepID=UPI002897DA3A|nr:hypothetical protein [Neobacillus sp.]
MVIQSNMSPKAIVEVWENTVDVFNKYKVPLTEEILETFVEADILGTLLKEINTIVGSSTVTCVEGG